MYLKTDWKNVFHRMQKERESCPLLIYFFLYACINVHFTYQFHYCQSWVFSKQKKTWFSLSFFGTDHSGKFHVFTKSTRVSHTRRIVSLHLFFGISWSCRCWFSGITIIRFVFWQQVKPIPSSLQLFIQSPLQKKEKQESLTCIIHQQIISCP